MKIFVAIPVYDGKLPVQTATCLLNEVSVANGLGDELRVNFLPSCSVIAHGRNQLVQMFLDSDCDRMFFLDSDITFEPGALVKTCHMPFDIVGGCYRYREKNESYPIAWLPGNELWANKYGLLEVAMLPTGFLALSREAFEKFKAHYPNREYTHWNAKMYGYFQMAFKDGAMHSDDSYFCKEWRDMGGKIYLDPELTLGHWDFNPTPHIGNIGSFIKRKTPQEIIDKHKEGL
jgi:hypothetical protein